MLVKTPVCYDDTQPFGYRDFQLPEGDKRGYGDHYGIRDAEGKGIVGCDEYMVFRSDDIAREIAATLNLFPLLARVLAYWMQTIESNEGRSDEMDVQVDLARSMFKTLRAMGAIPHTRAPDETSKVNP